MEVHGAWAVSLQSVAGRLATPLGHIKKKKRAQVLEKKRRSSRTGPSGQSEVSKDGGGRGEWVH